MSDVAAFLATYSDWKVIKGRKVVQIVLEKSLETSDEAYKILGGMPNPAAEVWVGVSAIDPKKIGLSCLSGEPGEDRDDSLKSGRHALYNNVTEGSTASASRKGPARSLSQKAFLFCNEPSGRMFLEQRRRHAIPAANHINNVDEAKHVLRAWLGIESLSELDRDPSAADRWDHIETDYKTWLTAARYVEAP